MAHDYSEELQLAATSVQIASALTKTVLPSNDKGAISKSDLSPVTIGDFAVQALLTSLISSRYPSDGFVGEESADALRENSELCDRVWELVQSTKPDVEAAGLGAALPQSKEEMLKVIDQGGRGKGGRVGRIWVFDPIDGTATFMKGQQYAVNLALLVDGKQQLSVIGCPNLAPGTTDIQETTVDLSGQGLMLHAIRGQGAFVRPMSRGQLLEAKRLLRHAEHVEKDALRFTDSTVTSSAAVEVHQKVAESLNGVWPGPNLWSTLMRYTALGLGAANCFVRVFKFRHYKSCIWDHAGGMLLFEEVGGKVTDLDGKEIDFGAGRKMSENYGVVAAPPNCHALVLETAQKAMKEAGLE